MKECKILDCTLRDGGYYNNWDFEPEVVEAYLDSVVKAKIDFVELGLRNFPQSEFLGAFAYTTEDYLNSLDLPVGPMYGVMVDAKTILSSSLSVKEAVDKLFVPANQSRVSLVRVAAHFGEVEKSGPIVEYLKALGYKVGYNLMQAGGKPTEVITAKAKQASEWRELDVLYFADSLGNMDTHEVERIVNAIRLGWKGELGIHTHNNMGKGLDNTLAASNVGVTWLDTTVTGMGRGAGNTQTESLLAMLDKMGSRYNSRPIYELVIRYFEKMQKDYGWGSNLLYFLGAQNDVHPTYIQNLLSNAHYGTEEIVGAIDYLSKLDGTTSYNGAVLNSALSFNSSCRPISGSLAIKSLFQQKDILIVTNGLSTSKYSNAIELYINKNKPVVISINLVESIPSHLIDYYVVSHNSKYLSDASRYESVDKPIVLPKHRFSETELECISKCTIIDYGLDVKSNLIASNGSHAVIPFDITTAYLLAMLLESKPRTIKSVGFDGYEKNDPRQQEMLSILELYEGAGGERITSLTPTSYPMNKGSVYAPNV
ncbi:pyruvate carboxyltransferase [Vibrio lentus]|uniref:aldolase catalytic domain-containing protein n=1 Tax=Vibrio lentus TaxID=136468 RepID=UPI000C822C2F|nr:aldolase catalytic domain-containing protein [Vibrio lentus]MCC4816396.1 aldolase catalytic domain-containing protein [Vibrio lentus]PMG69735.1 pyruvate carboxyltransferase [Vibrio lentus]PMK90296.1 pyruvate carboxyltransferase [Vibrio lentus]PML20381.1 pyruvate carboxyltransferase [Vibrio lentus]PMM25361.1 pyruvate carboxyltransferase [Vibrio lentus]